MSIYLYSGTPGTGKSLHAASEIRFQLSRPTPRPVIGNFELAPDAPVKSPDLFRFYENNQLSPNLLVDFATDFWESTGTPFREDYITLVLDEAQLLFNSRLWSQADRMAYLSFFSQHRKYGYKVIFIAQSAKMIDNQFRMLIEYETNHRKIDSMGIIGGLLGIPFRGKIFMYVDYLFQTHERLGSSWYVAKRRDMAMYDSYKKFVRS